jgi:hypothetical protein
MLCSYLNDICCNHIEPSLYGNEYRYSPRVREKWNTILENHYNSICYKDPNFANITSKKDTIEYFYNILRKTGESNLEIFIINSTIANNNN